MALEPIPIGTKIMLKASSDICLTRAIAEGQLLPVSIVGVPTTALDDGVRRSLVIVTGPGVCVLGTVISLDVPDVLNHEVGVEMFGIVGLVVSGVSVAQDAAREEDFSLGVWNRHDERIF